VETSYFSYSPNCCTGQEKQFWCHVCLENRFTRYCQPRTVPTGWSGSVAHPLAQIGQQQLH